MKRTILAAALAAFCLGGEAKAQTVVSIPGCTVWPDIPLRNVESLLQDLRDRVALARSGKMTLQDAYDADAKVNAFNDGISQMIAKARTDGEHAAVVSVVRALDEILDLVPPGTPWGDEPRLWRVKFRGSVLTVYFHSRCLPEGIALGEGSAALARGHPEVEAELLTNLTSLLIENGDLEKAESAGARVLELVPSPARLPEVQMVTAAYNALGVARRRFVDLYAAVDYYRRGEVFLESETVRRILAEAAKENPLVVQEIERYRAGFALNQAVALSDREDPAKLTPLYDRALAIREKIHGPDHLEVAVVLRSRAQNALRRGELRAARDDLDRAVAIVRKSAKPGDIARTLAESAQLALGEGDLAKAVAEADEAYATIAPPEQTTPAVVVLVLRILGQVSNAAKQHDKALAAFAKALGVQKDYAGEANPVTAELLADLASTHRTMGRHDEALKGARLAGAAAALWLEGQSVECGAGDPPRAGAMAGIFELVLDASFETLQRPRAKPLSQKDVQTLHEDILVAAQMATFDRTGAGTLRSAVRQRLAGQPAIREYLDLLARRCALEAEALSRRSESGETGPWSERIAEVQRQIQHLFADIRALEAKIGARELALLRSGRTIVSLAMAKQLLRQDEAAVILRPAQGSTALVLLVNRSDGLHVHAARLPLNAVDLAVMVDEWRRLIVPVGNRYPDDAALREANKAVAEYLLPREIVAQMQNVDHIFFIGDGALERWPAPLLPTADGFLRDLAPVSVLPSLSALAAVRGTAKAAGSRAVVAIGDPKLDQFRPCSKTGDDDFPVPPPDALHREIRCLGTIQLAGKLLKKITALLPQAGFLAGADASLANVKSFDFGTAGVAVFMTHGLTGDRREISYLDEPALILTPSRTDPRDDGLLKASEIAKIDLDSIWLAIIGACQTAASNRADGGEGFSGLALAFYAAGARAVVVSHWKAGEQATDALIAAMIERLAADPAKTLAAALHESADAMAANERLAKPYLQHAFVVVGDGAVTMPPP